MANRDSIAKFLKVDSLEDYIINEFKIGRTDAVNLMDTVFDGTIKELEKIESNENKTVRILSELIRVKSEISFIYNDFFFQMVEGAKFYALNSSLDITKEEDQLNNLAKYILNFFEFNKSHDFLIQTELKSIKINSKKHHLVSIYISNSQLYFDILNDICKIDDFTWDWVNFEKGLIQVLLNYELDKISLKSNSKFEIETSEIRKNREMEELKYEIEVLNREVERQKGEIEFQKDYYNKYYYESQVLIANTYFGDNQPFLFNLYNFLKKNTLLPFGWSYFYSCLLIGNNEMIPLTTSKKLNFIGRIFYNLKDYLVLHYKDDSFKFLQSKFLVNDAPISDYFRTNHMKTYFDKEDEPELIEIDEFFERQKKIYHKM